MKTTFYILIFISLSRQLLGQTSPDKSVYGTYIAYKWGCCFSCNCGTKYILTLNNDSTYILEQFKYTSPIKGKWWKYTLDKYEREYKYWSIKNDTLIFPEDNLVDGRLLIKNKKLIRSSDQVLLDIYGNDYLKSNPQIRKRQFKKKNAFFLNRKIKKHIRHRD